MPTPDQNQPSGEPRNEVERQDAVANIHEFNELAGGQIEAQITYAGQTYRLRKTKKGGLILTK